MNNNIDWGELVAYILGLMTGLVIVKAILI